MSKSTISAYEFLKLFPDENSARRRIESIRWPDGPVCPECGSALAIGLQTRKGIGGYYRCNACHTTFTVRTGTIFERSHIPLDKWLYAMYLLATSRKGVSSMQLSKELGLTQKTAWFLLHRLREACGHDKDDRQGGGMPDGLLSGIVEAYEAYIGGKESNKHESDRLKMGRGPIGKMPILGMRERKGKPRAIALDGTEKACIQGAVKEAVADGATLITDEHAAYVGMDRYVHYAVNHSAKQYVDGMAHTNGIESVWTLLKRGYYGVYHSFTKKHLQRYLNELMYRLSAGRCEVSEI